MISPPPEHFITRRSPFSPAGKMRVYLSIHQAHLLGFLFVLIGVPTAQSQVISQGTNPQVVFSDDFSGSFPGANWVIEPTTCGTSDPAISAGTGNPGPSLEMSINGSCNSVLSAVNPFPTAGGVSISVDIASLDQSGVSVFSIFSRNSGNLSLVQIVGKVILYQIGSSAFQQNLSTFDTNFHTFTFQVDTSGNAAFFRDGTEEFAKPGAFTPSQLPLIVRLQGGFNTSPPSTPVFFDNVKVVGTPLVIPSSPPNLVFSEDLSGDFPGANWDISACGGLKPEISPTTGNPVPSLEMNVNGFCSAAQSVAIPVSTTGGVAISVDIALQDQNGGAGFLVFDEDFIALSSLQIRGNSYSWFASSEKVFFNFDINFHTFTLLIDTSGNMFFLRDGIVQAIEPGTFKPSQVIVLLRGLSNATPIFFDNVRVMTVSPTDTTTSLNVSPASSVAGSAVTLTSTVAVPPPGSGTPTGSVAFFDGGTSLGTGMLNASLQAVLQTSALTAGGHSLTSKYLGDTTFAPSISAAIAFTVKDTTTTALSPLSPAPAGSTVTFTATVTSTGSGAPSGSVSFLDGTAVMGSATLNGNGVAMFPTATLAEGTHSISAAYPGSAAFAGSSSAAASQVITTDSVVSSISFNTATVSSSSTLTGTLTLNKVAATGAAINVSSNDPSVQVPSMVAILPGKSSATFTATTTGVQTQTVVTVTATLNGSVTTRLTLLPGLHFVAVMPCRVADTRNPAGPFGGPFLTANSSRSFNIPASACDIPVDAQAYSVNMTVVPKGPLGFLTIFPCGQSLPIASTLNAVDGRVKAGAAIVPAGTGGTVCVFVTNDTEAIIDINGYFVPPSAAISLAFFPMTPCRLVDTRGPAGSLGGPSLAGDTARTFPILSSSCGVPGTAQAYSLNYTSVPSGKLGFLTTWPAGQAQPLVSTLNAPTGAITANAAIVPAGTNGGISVFVTNPSDLVIDINGYFALPGLGGLSFVPLTPCRILDTRNPSGSPPVSGMLNVNVSASDCGVGPSAQSFALNATVVPPGPLGFISLWPEGDPQPLVSTLNASDATVTSNMAIVPSTNGAISIFASDLTHLVLDISGYFAP